MTYYYFLTLLFPVCIVSKPVFQKKKTQKFIGIHKMTKSVRHLIFVTHLSKFSVILKTEDTRATKSLGSHKPVILRMGK